MNDLVYQEAVKEAVKDKFKGKEYLQSKVTPRYPISAERELKRITTAYMKMYNAALKEVLPDLMQEYKVAKREDARMDDMRDFAAIARQKILEAAAKLEKRLSEFALERRLERVARQVQNSVRSDWKRVVKRSLGVDILESYYNDAFYDVVMKKWIADNVSKIQSIPSQSFNNMEHIILDGYAKKKTIGAIAREIQEEYDLTKKKAKMIARDQMGTLSGQISQLQQTDAGVTRYKWSSSHDERVRDCHRGFNGKIFEWDKPPAEWYETKSRGRVYTGNYYHPGEAYQCRCVAIPIFPWETVNIPIDEKDKQNEQRDY